jgi:hypothetical protein
MQIRSTPSARQLRPDPFAGRRLDDLNVANAIAVDHRGRLAKGIVDKP